jgi:hypothetical protein
MKFFEFSIDQFQVKKLFQPIRKKSDVIELWMNTIKLFLVYTPTSVSQKKGTVKLVVSKMNRIFYETDKKIFSLNFPFSVSETNGKFLFRNHHCSDIDSAITSEVLSLINTHGIFSANGILDFFEPLFESCAIDPEIWEFMKELLLSEEGYVRYDHDLEQQNGHLHPINHLDIFYSSSSTFKIGLRNTVTIDELTDIFNSLTECQYLSDP